MTIFLQTPVFKRYSAKIRIPRPMNTAIDSTSQPPDLLRLGICPQCEYSLEGLPSEGICPECGRPYDQSITIVHCLGPMSQGLQGSLTRAILISLATVTFSALRLFFPTHSGRPIFSLVAGFSIVMLILGWIDRLTSPRRGQWLLWMSPLGIGLQREFDPDSLLAKLRLAIPITYWIAFAFLAFWPVSGQMSSWISLLMAIVFAVCIFLVRYAIRPRLALPPDGHRPGLIAWDQLQRLRFERYTDTRCRLTATHLSWLRRDRTIDVFIEGSHEFLLQFRARLRQYSAHPNI